MGMCAHRFAGHGSISSWTTSDCPTSQQELITEFRVHRNRAIRDGGGALRSPVPSDRPHVEPNDGRRIDHGGDGTTENFMLSRHNRGADHGRPRPRGNPPTHCFGSSDHRTCLAGEHQCCPLRLPAWGFQGHHQQPHPWLLRSQALSVSGLQHAVAFRRPLLSIPGRLGYPKTSRGGEADVAVGASMVSSC